MLKPPLTYYGGKQKLTPTILPLIPKHNLYCEPFFGGGAVFFGKESSKVEVVNDLDGNLITFYRVLKNDYKKLNKEIQATLYSRELHHTAKIILGYPQLFSSVKSAWALWVLIHEGYCSMMDGVWGYEKKSDSAVKRFHNKKTNFLKEYSQRLERTQIECRDALEVIKSRDTDQSFFYCDPPYFNSYQKYSTNYTEADYKKLLDVLANMKGKFLLSSYPSEILTTYIKKYKWFSKEIDMPVSVVARYGKGKRKTEMLVANYKISEE
jgi:DNA adenine methylase